MKKIMLSPGLFCICLLVLGLVTLSSSPSLYTFLFLEFTIEGGRKNNASTWTVLHLAIRVRFSCPLILPLPLSVCLSLSLTFPIKQRKN